MDARIKVKRPTDVYDVDGWNAYWASNPHLLRGVGADVEGDEGDEGDGAGGEGSEGGGETVDELPGSAEELAALVASLKAEKKGLEDEKAKLLKDTMKNKGKAKDATAAAEGAAARLTAIEGQLKELLGDDLTLDDLQARITARKAEEADRLEKAGKFTELRNQMKAAHEKEISTLKTTLESQVAEKDKALASADTEIRRLLVSNSFASSTLVKDELTLTPSKAEKLFGEHFKIEAGEDGRREIRAFLGDKPIVNAEGSFVGFDAALRMIVDADPEKETLFRSKARAGSGSGTDASDSAGTIQKDRPRGVGAIQAGLKALKS